MATRKKKPTKAKKAPAKRAPAKKKKKAAPARRPAAKKQPAPKKATARKPPMHAVVDPMDLADEAANGNDETFEIFKSFDRDGSGSIDRGEFARLLEALGQVISDEELSIAIDVVDSNRSGRISWPEFQAWWSAR